MSGKPKRTTIEVENIEKYFPKGMKREYVNLNPLTIQHSTSVLMYGKTRAGKTNCLINLLLNPATCMTYQKIYVICKDKSEDKYRFLSDHCTMIDEQMAAAGYPNTNILKIVEGVENIPDLNKEIDATKQNIIIFDDLMLEKNQDPIIEFYIRALKRNCSCFYLAQDYYKVPKRIRSNIYYYLIWELPNRLEATRMYNEITDGEDMSRGQFNKLVRGVTSNRIDHKKHGWLMIDKKTENKNLKYRDGFNMLPEHLKHLVAGTDGERSEPDEPTEAESDDD